MNIKTLIIGILFLFSNKILIAQEKINLLNSRADIEKVIGDNAILQNKDLIIYSIADKKLMIIIKNVEFDIILFQKNNIDDNNFQFYKNFKPKKKDYTLIENMFTLSDKCFFNELTWRNYRYTNANGNPNYFVIKKSNKNYCEFELSVVITPTPIPEEYYYYINKIVFNEIPWNSNVK